MKIYDKTVLSTVLTAIGTHFGVVGTPANVKFTFAAVMVGLFDNAMSIRQEHELTV